MALVIPGALQGSSGPVHHLALLWQITRTDGTQYFFTSHDTAIEFDNGAGEQTFTPVGAFDASARRREAGLRDQDVSSTGPIVAGAIEAADLAGGLFSDAEVVQWLIDWRAPWVGAYQTTKNWIADLSFDGEVWRAEMVGLTNWLSSKVGRVFGRLCSADLGDSRCKYVVGTNSWDEVSGVNVKAGSQDPDEPRRVFAAVFGDIPTSGPLEDEYQHGLLTWSTGANEGLTAEVKFYGHTSTAAQRDIELHLPMPFDIADGDDFQIRTGCARTLAACKDKFDNVPNHRGYPTMPGTDDVLETPVL